MEKDIIIHMKQSMPTFSKSQKKIAQALIDNYQETAYMTASRLGALVGVSESTVVRFAYELGYDGWELVAVNGNVMFLKRELED